MDLCKPITDFFARNYVPASFQFSYDAVPQFHLSHFAFDQSSIRIHVLLNHDILFSFAYILMLLKVVLYAYTQSVFSGRKIEKLLNDNIRMMWLS